ncbi:MAG: hypothetical protein FJX44_00040 [Alphaproteobacteria bacterium]|nr:hypothetical protein [Alphaproteobacteria bacterium]
MDKLQVREGPRIEKIDLAKPGVEEFIPATMDNIRDSLKRFGVAIVREAFDVAEIEGLIENATAHAAKVEAAARDGTIGKFARAVADIDPETAGCTSNFTETSLYKALMRGVVRSMLLEAIGPDVYWVNAQARVVVPDSNLDKNGRLPLHIERRAFKYDGLHNIWTPLTPQGVVTNVDTPGLQFFVGRLDYFQSLSPETEESIVKYLSSIGRESHRHGLQGDKYGFFFRPKLKAGDVALFTGFAPHTGYIPENARLTRVAFDIRIFPKCDAPDIKPLCLAA